MKSVFLFLLVNLICSNTFAALGLKGPESEGILFYPENDYIVVKHCSPSFSIGPKYSKARSTCVGKETKVPLKSLDSVILHGLSQSILTFTQSIPLAERENFFKKDMRSEKIAKALYELERLNLIVKKSGRSSFLTLQDLFQHPERSLSYITELTRSIIKQKTKFEFIDAQKNKNSLLYELLKNFDTYNIPCGNDGDISHRIQECSLLEKSQKGSFVLVTRSPTGLEFWQDQSRQILWADGSAATMKFESASSVCPKIFSSLFPSALTWRLPTPREIKEADKNGLRNLKSVTDKHRYWTSSVHGNKATIYDGSTGRLSSHPADVSDVFSVRCVLGPLN